MDETWEDIMKDLLEDWKYKAFKCKKKSLPTYPPADSVGRQCQTNNILRVAQYIWKLYNLKVFGNTKLKGLNRIARIG